VCRFNTAVADLEGFLGFQEKPPLRFQELPEILQEDAMKLKFFEDSAMPLFLTGLWILQAIQARCVKSEQLLLAKFDLMCYEMLKKNIWLQLFFSFSTNSELDSLQNQKPPFENPTGGVDPPLHGVSLRFFCFQLFENLASIPSKE